MVDPVELGVWDALGGELVARPVVPPVVPPDEGPVELGGVVPEVLEVEPPALEVAPSVVWPPVVPAGAPEEAPVPLEVAPTADVGPAVPAEPTIEVEPAEVEPEPVAVDVAGVAAPFIAATAWVLCWLACCSLARPVRKVELAGELMLRMAAAT